jgi:predicted regulator of Ras-like GTPase activity (Roadblock/LC7/MglB family)
VDPEQALNDLMDVSSQIETAVIYETSGDVVASTHSDEEQGKRFAQAARDLFASAQEAKSGSRELTHLEAATAEGSVFVVRKGERTIAAITPAEPTVALVFYDLRTCLENAPADQKPKKRAAPRKPKKVEDGAS